MFGRLWCEACRMPRRTVPLLHVGYQKTGSTWLQREFFPSRKTGFELVAGVDELQLALVRPPSLAFDPEAPRQAFAARLEAVRERGLVPALSYERLSGNPHHAGRDGGWMAERLQAVFPDARVLIVFREQRSMALSMYKTYVRLGGVATIRQYFAEWSEQVVPPLFDFEYLAYHRQIRRYHELFGADRVLALPYEFLRERPREFVDRLASFAGAEVRRYPKFRLVNSSYSALGLELKRHANRLLVETPFGTSPITPIRAAPKALRRLASKVDARLPGPLKEAWDERWRRFVEEKVGDRYAKSNAEAAALTGEDLKGFGYSL